MSASQSSAEPGLPLLREGLIRHEKEVAAVKKKLSESQGELQRVRQQAHDQLKQTTSVNKEKLVEANAALATSYQDAEELRRKLARAEAKEKVVKQEQVAHDAMGGMELNGNEATCPPLADELFSAMDEACMHYAVQPRDEEEVHRMPKKPCGRPPNNKRQNPPVKRATALKASDKTRMNAPTTSGTAGTGELRSSGDSATSEAPKKRGRPAKATPFRQ